MARTGPKFLSVPCPTCKVGIGVHCISAAGLDYTPGHRPRKLKLARAQAPRVLKDTTPLTQVGLSTRAFHVLSKLGCTTVADARKLTDKRIGNAINSGKKTVDEVRKAVGYAEGNGPDLIDPDARTRRFTVVMADPEAPDFTWTVHVWATTPAHAEAQAVVGTPQIPRVFAVFRGHLSNLLPTVDESTEA